MPSGISSEQHFFEAEAKSSWTYTEFKDKLAASKFNEFKGLDELPSVINIGKFGTEADRIIRETLEDPERRERAVTAKLGMDGRVTLSEHTEVGTPTRVTSRTSVKAKKFIDSEYPWYDNSEKVIAVIHSHPIDQNVSNLDLLPLIRADSAKRHVAALVTTPAIKLLFLRTKNSGGLSEENLKHLDTAMNKVIMARTDERETIASLGPLRLTKGIGVAPSIAVNSVVKDICEEFDIAVYSAKYGSIYKKVSL